MRYYPKIGLARKNGSFADLRKRRADELHHNRRVEKFVKHCEDQQKRPMESMIDWATERRIYESKRKNMSSKEQVNPLDIQTLVCAMDAVQEAKTRDEIEKAPSIPKQKEQLLKKLRETYDQQEITVSDEIIKRGVDEYFEKRFAFTPADPRLSKRLAGYYINRKNIFQKTGKIAKRLVFATLIALGVTKSGTMIVESVHKKELAENISKFEQIQKNEIQTIQNIRNDAENLERKTYPESNHDPVSEGILKTKKTVDKRISSLKEELEKRQKLFENVSVPKENKIDAQKSLGTLKRIPDTKDLSKEMSTIQDLSEIPDKLVATHMRVKLLKTQSEEEFSNTPVAGLINSLETQINYAFALPDIQESEKIERKMEKTLKEARELKILPEKIKRASEAAQAISKDPEADKLIQEITAKALSQLASSNRDKVEKSIQELESITDRLTQSYEIIIYQHPGEKTGVWRHPRTNKSHKVFYVIVEAVSNGEAIPLQIRNEETGKTTRNMKWAERITEQEYEKIKNEKQSRGNVRNNKFADKKYGFLEPVYSQGVKAENSTEQEKDLQSGRITQW